MEKLMMFGLGGVGRSFLKQYVKTNYADTERIICIEADSEALTFFLECGGLRENFHAAMLDESNTFEYLNMLERGDFLIDFANNIKTLDVLPWALEHGIHYISLADAGWDDDPNECNGFRPRFLEYKKLKKSSGSGENTSIVMYGMNPGLISAFVKKCISEIISSADNSYMKKTKTDLTD